MAKRTRPHIESRVRPSLGAKVGFVGTCDCSSFLPEPLPSPAPASRDAPARSRSGDRRRRNAMPRNRPEGRFSEKGKEKNLMMIELLVD